MNVNRLTQSGVKFVFYVADYFALMNNKMDGDIDKIRACLGGVVFLLVFVLVRFLFFFPSLGFRCSFCVWAFVFLSRRIYIHLVSSKIWKDA